jgi:hypothetical protein
MYFEDLSDYSYAEHFSRPRTKNIGWLASNHSYKKGKQSSHTLDSIWNLCEISVARARGIHECDLCTSKESYKAEKGGKTLLLGNSEIRLFGNKSIIYAAPTLIYHYVSVHEYQPPDCFLAALRNGLIPPHPDYFELLNTVGLEWRQTQSA